MCDDGDGSIGELTRVGVASPESVEEERAGFGVVGACAGWHDELVGVLDDLQPDRIGLIVSGIDKYQSVVFPDDIPDEVDVLWSDALLCGQDEWLATENIVSVCGLVVDEMGEVCALRA